MEFITNLYVMILNLIKTIMGMFNAPTDYVDGLLGQVDKAEGEDTEATA